jgi:hypothetical protein
MSQLFKEPIQNEDEIPESCNIPTEICINI